MTGGYRQTTRWRVSWSCSPISRRSWARTAFASAPTARRPPASARRGVSVAQLAVDGKATELQGIGKTIEAKIVEAVEDGEMHALHEAARRGARARWPLPAAARARAEDGRPDLARARRDQRWPSCAEPPRRGGCARSRAWASGARRRSWRRSSRASETTLRGGACSGSGCRSFATWSRRFARTRRRSRCPRPAACAAGARASETST